MIRTTPHGVRQRAPLAGIAVIAVALLTTLAGAVTAATDRRAPRIVTAAMLDGDRDGRADGLRVTYSERVRHAHDADGRYPFVVIGYPVRSVGAARGKVVLIALHEPPTADPAARPRIRYRPTRLGPVSDSAGNQAAEQTLLATHGHGFRPAEPAPPAPAPPAPPAAPSDRDGDGFVDGRDCGPDDPAIRPGALDVPDLAFVDANCDGIDGDETRAVFVSPDGDNTNPGTRAAPKREIAAAVPIAAAADKDVYAAAGRYAIVTLASRVSIYGGYRVRDWARQTGERTLIAGAPLGVLGHQVTGVTLQLVSVHGDPGIGDATSAYGVLLTGGSRVRLQRVTVTAADARSGLDAGPGAAGRPGESGGAGLNGECDGIAGFRGGPGGASPAGRSGGRGGNGGADDSAGTPGESATPGGAGGEGGAAGNPGKRGRSGLSGENGAEGGGGTGESNPSLFAANGWRPGRGQTGERGAPGNGGGGGGGGGAQSGIFVDDGQGNGGGGGGGGGEGGAGGNGGGGAGGSFGIYLHASTVLVLDGSLVTAGNGGAGGRGGNGGQGGGGGSGGVGATYCTDEIGAGGSGGAGGRGGEGGGGAGGHGGPSIGILRLAGATAAVEGSIVEHGAGGPGGVGGRSGSASARPGAVGIAAAIHEHT